MATPVEQVAPSQAAFNDRTLKYYDWLLEFTSNRIWRCPIERTLELYQRYLSANHLEVGVGTGYFLDRSSTVLRQAVPCDLRARAFMRFYNARKVFCNLQDGLGGLTRALEENFRNVQIDVIGCVAQFSGRA
jgi:hypothetical protein